MERLLVRPVRNDVTIIKAGAKGFFGRTPCLDSRKWSRTVGESATHTATCQQPRPLLSCFACKAPSMTPVAGCTSSPTHWLPFNNTCCFLILRCFYLSSPPLSVSLPLFPSLPRSHLLILVSRPPSTSIVEFRQAIYIVLPGCFTLPLL